MYMYYRIAVCVGDLSIAELPWVGNEEHCEGGKHTVVHNVTCSYTFLLLTSDDFKDVYISTNHNL